MEENINTADSEHEWENPVANISHHVETSNKKKKEDLEVLVDNKALDLDGVSLLAEKTIMSESTTIVSNSTIHISSVKTNSTDHRMTAEETALATMATDITATINHTPPPPPDSTEKGGSLKATFRLEETNSTETLGYWDLLQSWLPQVWK